MVTSLETDFACFSFGLYAFCVNGCSAHQVFDEMSVPNLN